MKHHDVEERLIDRTIQVIAEEGLEKTTTKAIVKGTNINEAYIYRFFEDKDDLLRKTFDSLDNELVKVSIESASLMTETTGSSKEKARSMFVTVWRFLLGNSAKCLSYIRYFYSPYFKKYSVESHTDRYRPLVDIFSVEFKAEANVWMLLNHIFNVMLDFAVKVFNGQVPDNDDTEEHVFRLVFQSIEQYFKKEEASLS